MGVTQLPVVSSTCRTVLKLLSSGVTDLNTANRDIKKKYCGQLLLGSCQFASNEDSSVFVTAALQLPSSEQTSLFLHGELRREVRESSFYHRRNLWVTHPELIPNQLPLLDNVTDALIDAILRCSACSASEISLRTIRLSLVTPVVIHEIAAGHPG